MSKLVRIALEATYDPSVDPDHTAEEQVAYLLEHESDAIETLVGLDDSRLIVEVVNE